MWRFLHGHVLHGNQVAQAGGENGARRWPRDQHVHRTVRCEADVDVLGWRAPVEFGRHRRHAIGAGAESDRADNGHVENVRLAGVQLFDRECRVSGAEPHSVLVHFLLWCATCERKRSQQQKKDTRFINRLPSVKVDLYKSTGSGGSSFDWGQQKRC